MNPEYLDKATYEEHANSMQWDPRLGFKSKPFLLQSDTATKHAPSCSLCSFIVTGEEKGKNTAI